MLFNAFRKNLYISKAPKIFDIKSCCDSCDKGSIGELLGIIYKYFY
jgi:hypothetical protein